MPQKKEKTTRIPVYKGIPATRLQEISAGHEKMKVFRKPPVPETVEDCTNLYGPELTARIVAILIDYKDEFDDDFFILLRENITMLDQIAFSVIKEIITIYLGMDFHSFILQPKEERLIETKNLDGHIIIFNELVFRELPYNNVWRVLHNKGKSWLQLLILEDLLLWTATTDFERSI